MIYEDFLKDNVFSCENFDTFYTTIVFNDTEGFYQSFIFMKNKNDYKSSMMVGDWPHKYTLNKEKSKTYNNNYDEEKNETENWDYTCHYGRYYLSFNENEYETNLTTAFTSGNGVIVSPQGQSSIMNVLADNYYSCPASLCINKFQYDQLYIDWAFVNTFREGCIPSVVTTGTYSCGAIESFNKKYLSIIENLENLTNSELIELKKIREDAETFCSVAYTNLNYTDTNKCIIECKDFIKKINITNINDDSECGFSGRLILFIANIIRWVKYIIPIAVIILGILDFIKAIGADKEDEMKKAQQRFIKRLIAAALIFIIPFMLEFVLNKMGFDAMGCGIINL